MKQYLITEEELSIYLRLLAVKKHETDLTFKEIADDFLKDKQPVELLAEDYELQQKAINTLNDSGLKLMEENKQLKCTIAGLEKLLSNAVNETIIATGKVLPSAYGMLVGDETMQEVSNKIAAYWNKNIEIVVKEATSQK